MMLDLCSGKVGYTLYKGGKGNVTETEVNYWFRHGTCDKIVDSAREKMYKMMAEGKISFYILKKDDEYKENQGSWSDKGPFQLDSAGSSDDDLRLALPPNECRLVYTKTRSFLWTPEAASQEDRTYFAKHTVNKANGQDPSSVYEQVQTIPEGLPLEKEGECELL